jgi:hypothetical protein
MISSLKYFFLHLLSTSSWILEGFCCCFAFTTHRVIDSFWDLVLICKKENNQFLIVKIMEVVFFVAEKSEKKTILFDYTFFLCLSENTAKKKSLCFFMNAYNFER